jgi:hypothetical protein
MQCVFCTNPADDRPGAPLCSTCWDGIDEQVRANKAPLVPFDPMLVHLAEMFRRGGRDAEIALASGVASLGRRPGDLLN